MINFMIPGSKLFNINLFQDRSNFTGIQKYQNNPTSTSLDTKHYSIHNVEFPGITICANTKIMKSNFRTAMKAKNLPWRNLTQELIDKNTVASVEEFQYSLIQYLNNMAEFSIDPKGVELIDNRKLEKVFDDRKGDIAKLMGIVAPSCNRMLLVCRYQSLHTNLVLLFFIYFTFRWQGDYRNCSHMFKVKKTDDGYCCSFNTFEVSEVVRNKNYRR